MKIPITISGKKYTIKSIDELTALEFIDLSKIENCDPVKYIAWQTGVDLNTAFFAVSSKVIENAIGFGKDVTKQNPSFSLFKRDFIDTIGQRHQIENSGKEGLELLVFCLAVSQARSNNIDKVNELYQKYMSMPYAEVLGTGFFFLRSYRFGKRNEPNFLKRLVNLISLAKKKKAQE